MNTNRNPTFIPNATWVPMRATQKGKLIVVEGLDKSGKSTLVGNLEPRLASFGRKVTVTREPGGPVPPEGTPQTYANLTRTILLEPKKLGIAGTLPAEASLFYFLAGRFAHVHETIIPALERDEIVLCDRFSASSWSFQIEALGLGDIHQPHAKNLYLAACAMLPRQPDAFVFVSAPDEVLAARRIKPGEVINHVDEMPAEFHQAVRRGYERFFALDGLPPEPGLEWVSEKVLLATATGQEQFARRVVADGTLERQELADKVAADLAPFLQN
jgi:dTMP kinase